MEPTEQKRFNALYKQHLRGLKLHGYAASTIDVYSRAVRRLATYYDCVPDQLSVEQLIAAARKLRYRVFILTTYSMGLRLSETLSLQVGDIDAETPRVHIRRGKGHKDRFVPLPDLTCNALRALWARHHHPHLLFPNAVGSPERIRAATTHMSRGGTQKAFRVLLDECGIKKRYPFTPCATALLPTFSNAA